MRLLLFLVVSTVLLALGAYNYHFLIELNQRLSDLQKISQQQFLGSLHQRQLYRLDLDISTEGIMLDTGLSNSPIMEHHSDALARWPNRTKLQNMNADLENTIAKYFQHSDSPVPSDTGTKTLKRTLIDIQSYNMQLVDYLTRHSSRYLTQAFLINITVVAALLLSSLALLYRENIRRSQGSAIRERQRLNRHSESQQSKIVLFSILEDLKDQKNKSDQLAARLGTSMRDVKNKNIEMEQFIYTISHDLKSPLVSISGFSTMLAAQLETCLTEKHVHFLNRIQANVNDMESMLSDLLSLSRISKQSIEMERIDLTEVVQNVISTLDVQIGDSDVSFVIPEKLGLIVANERLIKQCLQNLIANALTYRSADRPLKIKVESEHQVDQTIVRVHDNGIGIEEQYHETIFRIFEHLNENAGTGVGLTIVKTVMEKHGGHVSLSSKINQGSIFSLHFPIVSHRELYE